MKVAVVCDWLLVYAGAERVLEQILKIYPKADVFCLVDFLEKDKRGFIQNKETHTSFIQKMPKAKTKYRTYLPLMPLAIEQLDVSGYDLIISSSHAVAKGVITGPNQLHISYVHSPIRYAWDLQYQYLQEAGLDTGIKSWAVRGILHYIRLWDYRTANGVDCFVANSKFIAKRIKKVYGRESTVIYPPVDVAAYTVQGQKEDFYLTASRMVPYKKVRLIVEAFNEMPDKKLVVIGDGTEFQKIKQMAKENIILMGYQPFEILKENLQKAKAFVFAAEEDFGITPVEAQACGTPVIAYGKGGATETVIGFDGSNYETATGVFFEMQTVGAVIDAVNRFESNMKGFNSKNCRKNAERFSVEEFKANFKKFVGEKIDEQ